MKVALVGEAWGTQESLWNHAFVGAAGKELADMLAEAGWPVAASTKYRSPGEMVKFWRDAGDNAGIRLFNVFNEQPEDNNVLQFFDRRGGLEPVCDDLPPLRPGKYLLQRYRPYIEQLRSDLLEYRPTLIVALGNTPCWAILGETRITALRGTIRFSQRFQCKVLPTFHPSYILQGGFNQRPIVLADLRKALSNASSIEVTRTSRSILIFPTLEELREWSQRPATYYAVDTETFRKQIGMIGFARNPTDACVIPFHAQEEFNTNGGYWPSVKDEVAAWRIVREMLHRLIDKVFQNGIYDLSYLFRCGIFPRRCVRDTMLRHHSEFPEMKKSLGFLASIYSAEIAWKLLRNTKPSLKRDE